MTNEDRIRMKTSTEEFAALLVQTRTEEQWDCDMDDEWYVCGYITVWITSDHQEYADYDDAIEHECAWLEEPA